MLSEHYETDFNYINEDRDQFTQTSASSVLFVSPLPKKTHDKNQNKVNTVFEYCQIIQDPDYPKSVTIVKEFVTEEVKDHPTTGENSRSSRYKYTREVIHPIFTPKQNNESCEVLVREALRSARKDFPDFYPSLEVYHSQKSSNRIKERIGERSLINKADAQTSYLNMDPDPDKVCLTDCDQAEDVKKCKQACRELNEARKSAPSGSPQQKPPCGIPVHRPPKCEKPPNCKPKQKKLCSPKSSSSNFDKDEGEVLNPDLNTDPNKNSDEVLVTDLNAIKIPNESSGEVIIVTDSNINIESNEIKNKEENKVDLGNIVPNIIFENDSSSEKSFVEAHSKAMSTIKVAMEDFMGIVYKTTQDAVALIGTESAKALAKIKAAEVANTNIQMCEKDLENKSSETIKNIGFFRKKKEDTTEENNQPGPGVEVIEKVLKTADSALNILSSKITKSLENLPKSFGKFNDSSSAYDQPKKDDKSSHAFTPETANGVFSALKNKIYSIFSDTEPKSDSPLSRRSTASSFFDDDDDK